jgi:hypothetical protein
MSKLGINLGARYQQCRQVSRDSGIEFLGIGVGPGIGGALVSGWPGCRRCPSIEVGLGGASASTTLARQGGVELGALDHEVTAKGAPQDRLRARSRLFGTGRQVGLGDRTFLKKFKIKNTQLRDLG